MDINLIKDGALQSFFLQFHEVTQVLLDLIVLWVFALLFFVYVVALEGHTFSFNALTFILQKKKSFHFSTSAQKSLSHPKTS